MVGSLFLTLLPIGFILVLLVVFKKPADISGIIGWALVSVIALLFFQTSVEVVLRSTAAGMIKSFPVSLIVATSLLQMAFMEKTGALRRIILFIKTLSCENKAVQIMMINIGFGTLMVAVGATPVSLLPPILIAMGYSTYVAIALPAIGYDALCTYALLGAPIVVFVDIANKFLGPAQQVTLSQVGSKFFIFLPVVSICIGLCMLWIVGKWKGLRNGLLPCLITGATIGIVSYFTNQFDNLVVLTGVLAGLAVIAVMVMYLVLTGKKVIDPTRLTAEEMEYCRTFPLWKAAFPWISLIGIILALNIPQSIFRFLYYDHTAPIRGLAADLKPIDTRIWWNAYTWIFISVLLSIPVLRARRNVLVDTLKVWKKRAPRPVFSAAIFFAIGEVMNLSGWSMEKGAYAVSSMVKVLADYSAELFRDTYSFIVAFIGLFGGFITGSEASTIGMFARYTMTTAQNLNAGLDGLIILTAGLAFGGGLASVISPAKLQNAAASIDKLGEETKVIRVAFVFSLVLTVITAGFVTLLFHIS